MNTQRLTELKNEIDTYRPLDQEQVRQLEQNIRIEHVWSSNAIEGSKLTRYETEAILQYGMTVHKESVSDVLNAIDLNEAYDYMMDLASRQQPLTTSIIRDLNRLSLAKTHPEWGGQYRIVSVKPNLVEFNPYAAPFDIRPEMDELIAWSHEAEKKLHPVQYAADLHLKFVTIHPFRDGNGRTARLLMNFALTEHGYPVVNIMPDKQSRTQYLETLLHCQKTNDPKKFENLVATYTEQTMAKRLKLLKLNEVNRKEAAKETNLSPEVLKKLMKESKLPDRDVDE
ncbi:MAG: Fic family protein [Lactobacillus sp.]|jgi:Fic family protein|nr:Fic family protein [Lactobacillus sp.]MCH4068953.1 Fic family protein [Lactobacillus sp.]MCI1303355.1 Fic family protein [Lactobacillus sp.]MCI1329431.1 Fic family protein [Lactobacillus sp.]MCI1359617.1 Fic family protein [Lactobacillus sp.]